MLMCQARHPLMPYCNKDSIRVSFSADPLQHATARHAAYPQEQNHELCIHRVLTASRACQKAKAAQLQCTCGH